MLVSLLQFYILLIAWMLAQCQASCDSGWFGQNCTLMCHCSSSQTCDDDGLCPDNEQCKQGFFGPGCQYVDVLQLNTTDGPDQFLRDGNDTTCNPQPDATVVAVNLTEPVPFTWFRVTLKDKKRMLNFTTTLNDVENCKNERKFPVNDTLVDVICERGTMMTSLKISGPAAGSICSLYISGGRNVALKQTATQSSTYGKFSESNAGNAVDGHSDMDYDHGHCSHTKIEPLNWWTLTFSQPQIIYKVVLYNRIGYVFERRLTDFIIETFDVDNKTSVQNYSFPSTGLAKYDLNVSTAVPVESFKLTQIIILSKKIDRVLTICEVEAFGDPVCPAETYGFYCENCKCNTTDSCHPFSGVCVQWCQLGFYGLNCSLRCFENCLHDVCEVHSGNCVRCVPGYVGPRCDTACDPGRFGSECGLYCSDRCTNNVCNNTNGHCNCMPQFTGTMCTECSDTSYGADCEHNCSNLCGNKLCDRYTGECLTCVGFRIGRFCQDCPWNYFGPLCASRCYPNCLNWTCDQVTGDCLGCEEGYEGKHCWKKSNRLWLIVIPIVTALFLLLFCGKRRGEIYLEA